MALVVEVVWVLTSGHPVGSFRFFVPLIVFRVDFFAKPVKLVL